MRRLGACCSRFELLEHAWDYEYDNRLRTLSTPTSGCSARRSTSPSAPTRSRPCAAPDIAFARRTERARLGPRPGHADLHDRDGRLACGPRRVPVLQLRADLNETVNDNLRSRLGEVQGLVATIDAPAGYNFAFGDEDETFVQVLRPNGTVIYFTQAAGDDPLVTAAEILLPAPRPVEPERSTPPNLKAGRALVAPPDESTDLAVAVGATPTTATRRLRLATLLLIGGSIAPLPASLAGYRGGSALRPVERMRRRAAEISAGDPGERLPVPPTDDELGRLGTTLNEMLERLEAAIERERRFVDDASHELRTRSPSTGPSRSWPCATARTRTAYVRRSARRSRRWTAWSRWPRRCWWSRARGGRPGAAREPAHVGDLFETLAQRFRRPRRDREPRHRDGRGGGADRERRPVAPRAGADRTGRQRAPPRRRRGSAVGRGARRLGRDPRDRRGRRLPEDFIAHAFERFSRADAARGRGGAGLGLAIVDTIARAHGAARRHATDLRAARTCRSRYQPLPCRVRRSFAFVPAMIAASVCTVPAFADITRNEASTEAGHRCGAGSTRTREPATSAWRCSMKGRLHHRRHGRAACQFFKVMLMSPVRARTASRTGRSPPTRSR